LCLSALFLPLLPKLWFCPSGSVILRASVAGFGSITGFNANKRSPLRDAIMLSMYNKSLERVLIKTLEGILPGVFERRYEYCP